MSGLLRPTASSYGKMRKETPVRARIEDNANVNPMAGTPRPAGGAQQQRANRPRLPPSGQPLLSDGNPLAGGSAATGDNDSAFCEGEDLKKGNAVAAASVASVPKNSGSSGVDGGGSGGVCDDSNGSGDGDDGGVACVASAAAMVVSPARLRPARTPSARSGGSMAVPDNDG